MPKTPLLPMIAAQRRKPNGRSWRISQSSAVTVNFRWQNTMPDQRPPSACCSFASAYTVIAGVSGVLSQVTSILTIPQMSTAMDEQTSLFCTYLRFAILTIAA